MTPPADIAEFVRQVRTATGLSQAAFADKYGLSARTLQGWEQGSREPDRAALLLLALIQIAPAKVELALASLLSQGKH